MKRLMGLAGLTVLALTSSACAQNTPDRSQDTAWINSQSLALASLKASDGWQSMEKGLRWRRIAGNGSGKHPAVTDTVTLHYAGRLTDGTEFDSSYARNEPAIFPLEALIEAWQLAVPKMGIGDTIELAVPAELGYGPRGKGPIPGGATLLFKIELLGIEGA
ncbi:MAG: FKBP-type peptidyl-prolyl cis-trans isomerase [Pseudomonadota bacterium]